jgi:tRNA nucleotidyltransferase/poly(A) polymerase
LISNFDYLNKLFKQIDENLSEKVNFYIIGGAVMLYYDLKKATKDIDIIVDSPKEFRTVEIGIKTLFLR